MTLHVPTITEDDLRAFHSKHLAGCPLPTTFLLDYVEVAEGNAEYYDDDDGLGWYDDGVKRTLTDEQIAMFRHSEIQTLLTERRLQREAEEDDEDVEAWTETFADVIEVLQPTVAADTVSSKEEAEVEDVLAQTTTELGNASEQAAEAVSAIIEESITTSTAPPESTIPTSSDAAESPALTSTQTPSSARPDSDGELPSDTEPRKRKVPPTNRNKQWRKRQKLKKQQKQQEKLQAEKAQEPEDFTPRRIAREQDEVVHANVDLDYD